MDHGVNIQQNATNVQDTQLCLLRSNAESGLTELLESLLTKADTRTTGFKTWVARDQFRGLLSEHKSSG
jgi:hypothetical protein